MSSGEFFLVFFCALPLSLFPLPLLERKRKSAADLRRDPAMIEEERELRRKREKKKLTRNFSKKNLKNNQDRSRGQSPRDDARDEEPVEEEQRSDCSRRFFFPDRRQSGGGPSRRRGRRRQAAEEAKGKQRRRRRRQKTLAVPSLVERVPLPRSLVLPEIDAAGGAGWSRGEARGVPRRGRGGRCESWREE